MIDLPSPSRRSVLRLFAAGTASAVLAACGSGRADAKGYPVAFSEAEWKRRLPQAVPDLAPGRHRAPIYFGAAERAPQGHLHLCGGRQSAVFKQHQI